MIPDIPLLRRRPLRSGLSKASYDRRLLLMRVEAKDSKETPSFEDTFEFNAATIHEWSHWFHHHATTFGVFLGSLRLSQQRTTQRILRDFPEAKSAALLDKRDKGKRPILPIDPLTQRPVFDLQDHALSIFQQIWYDHQWVHEALDGDIHLSLGDPPSEVFGEIFSDVMVALTGDGPLAAPGNPSIKEQRQWFNFKGRNSYISHNGTPVTSRLIMETSATIAELELILRTPWTEVLANSGRDQLNRRLQTLLEGDYGAPFRLFFSLTDYEADLFQALPTISMICFASLNPPVPPFVMSPPRGKSAYDWTEIYPPARFVRLAMAAKSVGLLADRQPVSHLSNYLSDLCEAAGLPPALDYHFPEITDSWGTIDFGNPTQRYPDNLQSDSSSYILWVQSKLFEDRRANLPFFALLGECMSGPYLHNHLELLLNLQKEVPYFRCPLHWTSNDKLGFLCPTDFGNWLFRSIALSEAHFDTIVGLGDYDLNSMPSEVSSSDAFQDFIKRSIEHNLVHSSNI